MKVRNIKISGTSSDVFLPTGSLQVTDLETGDLLPVLKIKDLDLNGGRGIVTATLEVYVGSLDLPVKAKVEEKEMRPGKGQRQMQERRTK